MAVFGLIALAFCGFYLLVLPVLVLTARRRVGDLENQVSLLKQEVASLQRLPGQPSAYASAPAAAAFEATSPEPTPPEPPPSEFTPSEPMLRENVAS